MPRIFLLLLLLLPLLLAGTRAHRRESRYAPRSVSGAASGDDRGDDLASVFLRLYSGYDASRFADAPLRQAGDLLRWMNVSKPTVIYVHGYTGSIDSRDTRAVVAGKPSAAAAVELAHWTRAESARCLAYAERGDHNVIATDWRRLAGQSYPSVAGSARLVGRALAGAVDEMVGKGLPPRTIHVVGHSMGAQVAGQLGRHASFQLSRITGLDPAGPLFNLIQPHLSRDDARFVDTIHTDAGLYGINRPSGAASFFPNGGRRVQPGCPTAYDLGSPEDYCSHHRSWMYYAESLRDEGAFVATNCTSYGAYARGSCDANARAPMGLAAPTGLSGVFYLRTRREAPFGMRAEGATCGDAASPGERTFDLHCG
ncbi:lipase member H-like [Phymastichus coffea]|uniref:lipase member H-like n=1 Tax=Phymastichus coffea TaxID=108790 RepID=UPI00273C8416|nr:lipase member H-like [Phymastichus coffea]